MDGINKILRNPRWEKQHTSWLVTELKFVEYFHTLSWDLYVECVCNWHYGSLPCCQGWTRTGQVALPSHWMNWTREPPSLHSWGTIALCTLLSFLSNPCGHPQIAVTSWNQWDWNWSDTPPCIHFVGPQHSGPYLCLIISPICHMWQHSLTPTRMMSVLVPLTQLGILSHQVTCTGSRDYDVDTLEEVSSMNWWQWETGMEGTMGQELFASETSVIISNRELQASALMDTEWSRLCLCWLCRDRIGRARGRISPKALG